MIGKSHKPELHILPKAERLKALTYLSGLYTSQYEGVLYLHFYCSLCGDTIVQTHTIENGSVDFEKQVAGKMVTDMRRLLAAHYAQECGSDRERRSETADILISKYTNRIYA